MSKDSLVDKFIRKLINDLKETAEDSVSEFILKNQDEIEKAMKNHVDETIRFINGLLGKPASSIKVSSGTSCEIHLGDDEISVDIEFPGFYGYKVYSATLNNNVLTILLRRDKNGKEKEGE